jgi:hypothetical protein
MFKYFADLFKNPISKDKFQEEYLTTIEVPETEWVDGIFYIETKSPKINKGGFAVYYDFRDPRPEAEEAYKSNNSERRLPYSGFYRSLVSNHVVKHPFNMKTPNRFMDDSTLISCPNCSNPGYISHGWRVQCNRCQTWIESYGNSLYVWANALRKSSGIMGTTFYHKNKVVSKEEFDKWQMYYKLLG